MNMPNRTNGAIAFRNSVKEKQTGSVGPLAKKRSKARRQAAKIEDDRARAQDEDLLRDIAAIVLEASEERRSLVIDKTDRVGLGVTITELVSVMRQIRPDLFQWDDDGDVDKAVNKSEPASVPAPPVKPVPSQIEPIPIGEVPTVSGSAVPIVPF